MTKALGLLPRKWWSFELPGYRPHLDEFGTYSEFPHEGLPPIERELDEEFRWLCAEPAVKGSLAEKDPADPQPSRQATSEQLEALLGDAGSALPRSFETFIGSREPRRRVRSCTACYLDLGDFAVRVSGGGQLVHFLSDQQWVLHWLLYSGSDGSEAVVVTEDPLGFVPDEESPRNFAREFDPSVSSDAAVCAESFSEFLYRFWIENEIWFAQADERRRLTHEQRRYAEHYLR